MQTSVLKSYPAGVPHEVHPAQYRSLAQMFEETEYFLDSLFIDPVIQPFAFVLNPGLHPIHRGQNWHDINDEQQRILGRMESIVATSAVQFIWHNAPPTTPEGPPKAGMGKM